MCFLFQHGPSELSVSSTTYRPYQAHFPGRIIRPLRDPDYIETADLAHRWYLLLFHLFFLQQERSIDDGNLTTFIDTTPYHLNFWQS